MEGEPNVNLPPKRVWGNQSERVISQRRVQLQEYLVRILEVFGRYRSLRMHVPALASRETAAV